MDTLFKLRLPLKGQRGLYLHVSAYKSDAVPSLWCPLYLNMVNVNHLTIPTCKPPMDLLTVFCLLLLSDCTTYSADCGCLDVSLCAAITF